MMGGKRKRKTRALISRLKEVDKSYLLKHPFCLPCI